MADRLKGITLEIGGDTTKLSKALSGVNSDIIKTKSALKDVERLLKLDPTNVELLRQKEKLLTDEIGSTKEKLDKLKDAQQTMDTSGVDKNTDQYMALQREIIATEQELGKLEDASNQANSALSKISETADKVASCAGKVASATKGLSTAAAGALAGIGGMAYSAVTSADDLNTLAKQSGFTTAELQKMKYAQDLIDVSMEDITSSAQKLKKNMGSSSGSVGEAFKQLGVNVRDSNGAMRDSTDVYWDVITALSKVGNETERDQLAMTLLGKGADSLAGIIDDGGAAFRALGKEAEDAGLILSQDTLDSLNAVNDKIDSTKAKAQATMASSGAKAMDALMPVFDKIIEAIGRVLEAIGGLDEGQIQLILTILAVVAAISPVASVIGKVSESISFLSGTVFPALSNAMSFIAANPIVLLIAAIVALVALIAVKGDEIQAILQKVDDFLQGVFTTDWTEVFGPVLGGILNTFFATFSDIWDSIKQVLDGVIDIIRGVFTGDWERVWEGVKEVFAGIFTGLEAIAEAPLNGIIGLLNMIIDGANWCIEKLNQIPGVNIDTFGDIPFFANGGTLYRGSAVVGDAGPEILTVSGGKATVTPLTGSGAAGRPATAASTEAIRTFVEVNFGGSLSQLAAVLQPAIVAETKRLGGSFTR